MTGRLAIVGLGPGSPGLITPLALETLAAAALQVLVDVVDGLDRGHRLQANFALDFCEVGAHQVEDFERRKGLANLPESHASLLSLCSNPNRAAGSCRPWFGRFQQAGAAQLGHLRGFDREGRLVALTTVRDRSEKGRVGLNQQSIGGRDARGFLYAYGLGKREDTAEADVEADGQRLFSFARAFGEAVDDAAQVRRSPVLRQ